ncbi:DUF4179 domain-containing protein [Peribacillus deserti]|uniref:DUF4179 domain-containing protein n=1 Tax=Peribacillus deserti TaxID=673318 RepID=A0A2N5M5K1_9BACI|nr:DUF4179 domain-containing protein [Peribacillus deserti]PLT29602.1 hypothetical protein CUU66_11890 [Peribacillus deserti]
MEKDQFIKHLNNAMENQVPDVWDELTRKIQHMEGERNGKVVHLKDKRIPRTKKRNRSKRLSLAAAACLLAISAFSYTPVLASIKEVYDKIFSSNHIDDTGLKTALSSGQGQAVNQTFYDKANDINVHFESILTDEKETKLLLTFQSKTTDLKNYNIDIFEGESSINLITGDVQRKKLKSVGWGSRYYDRKENKVAKALSFDSIKEYKGQNIRLEIKDITIYEEDGFGKAEALWPLEFMLDQSAVSTRETAEINQSFSYGKQTYTIKKVEFSSMETRVVVTGSDTKLLKDENGMEYRIMSKLEQQFLHARKIDKVYGYIVDPKKSGVFLKSAGEKVEPIFSKGEVAGERDEYLMIFAPVKDCRNTILEVGANIKIPLTK